MPRDEAEDFDGQPIDPQSAELQRALVAWSNEQEGDDGFEPDTDEGRAFDVVSATEGRELLAEATDPAREAREIAAQLADEQRDEPDPEPAPKPAPAADAKPAPVPALPDDTAALVAALPERHRPAVQALAERASAYADLETIGAPFADELKQAGLTLVDGYRTLAETHRFATTQPGEYMAWFTAKMVPEQHRAKALIEVAKSLGVTLIEDEFGLDDDGDKKPEPVNVEAVRQKASSDMLLATFESARGPDGQPAHPLFAQAHPLSGAVHRAMTAAIKQDVAAGKTAPTTVAQLRPYYSKAVEDITAALPGNTDAQEKVAKAKRASSPIATSVAAPRRAPAPTRPTARQDDGSDTLLEGLKALFPAGDDQ